MGLPPSSALQALRDEIAARSQSALARPMTHKDLLKLLDDAIGRAEDNEHDAYMGDDQ